jgi:hypothetical protein
LSFGFWALGFGFWILSFELLKDLIHALAFSLFVNRTPLRPFFGEEDL